MRADGHAGHLGREGRRDLPGDPLGPAREHGALDHLGREQRRRAVAEGVALLDAEARVTVANAALATMLGLQAAQMRGLAMRERVEPQHQAAWDAAVADASAGAVGSCAVCLRHADGHGVPVELTLRMASAGRTDALAICVRESTRGRDDDEMLRWIGVAPPVAATRLLIVEQSLPGDRPESEEEADRRGLPDIVIHDGEEWCLLIESKVQATLTEDQ